MKFVSDIKDKNQQTICSIEGLNKTANINEKSKYASLSNGIQEIEFLVVHNSKSVPKWKTQLDL